MMSLGTGITVPSTIAGLSDSNCLQDVTMCTLDSFNLNKLSHLDHHVTVFKVGAGPPKVQNYKYFPIYIQS